MDSIPIRKINAVQQEPDFSGSFSIRDIKELLNKNDMVQVLHRHDFYYILVLKKGVGYHEIDFTPYEVGDYAAFLMRPGQVHQLTLKAISTGYLIQFKPDFFYPQNKLSQELLRRVSHKNFWRLNDNRFKKLNFILAYMLKEYTDKQEGHQEVIKSGLNIFFIELMRYCQNKIIADTNTNPYIQAQLEKFLALLETHIVNHKQVSYYAGMLHISTYQLNAITKTSLNKTPSELIIEHIMLEAKRYLLATPNQIKDIADHLGYEDVSYFIRFFRKHSGYPPDAFRLNFK